jgi:hypothetical protein
MTTFNSPDVIVNKSAEDFFNLIGDLNNLKEVLPSEVTNFKSTVTTCSFKLSGMPELALEIVEKREFSKLSLSSTKGQVPFSLDCFIVDKGKQCQARLEINAELNFMMKMMVEKPLNQFLIVLANKIEKL